MKYENVISAVLRYLGVGQSYQGYEYVVDGIRLVLEDSDRLKYITKSLYPDIAKKYHTSWNCVERNIRTVIDVIWRQDNEKYLLEIWGDRAEEKPKNVQFFELMSSYIREISDSLTYSGRFPNSIVELAISREMSGNDDEILDGSGGSEEMNITEIGDCYCPETGKWCEEVECLRKQIIRMKQETADEAENGR